MKHFLFLLVLVSGLSYGADEGQAGPELGDPGVGRLEGVVAGIEGGLESEVQVGTFVEPGQQSSGSSSGSGSGQQSSGASSGSGSGQMSAGSGGGSGQQSSGSAAGMVPLLPTAVRGEVAEPSEASATPAVIDGDSLTCGRDASNKLVCRDKNGAIVAARETVADPSKIKSGQACHAECKHTGGFLGIGGKSGFDRPSCEPCMKQHPDVYAFINDGESEILMSKGDFCYDKCKTSRGPLGMLGLGKEKQFAQRRSCLECMQKNPRYRTALNPSFQKGAMGQANCTLSEDREYAYCNGDLYKKDTSVDTSDRSVPREERIGGSGVGESGRGSAGASGR